MEKLCIKCSKLLTLGVNWRPANKRMSLYKCNSCIKERVLQWQRDNPDKMRKYSRKYMSKEGVQDKWNKYVSKKYHKSKDGLNHVYVLPKENYAGVTNSKPRRKNEHKYSYLRFTDDMRVIYSTPNRAEAEELEALLHDHLGYLGKGNRK